MTPCPACGNKNAGSARYCASCGSALDPPTENLDPPTENKERKVVTILFCDLVGFTARSDRADPEDVGDALSAYHARVSREIERFGGTVEKFIGDAVMAVYGAPVAHEDDPQRAVLSALRIPPAMEELGRSVAGAPMAVRIGVETGEAVVRVGAERSGQGIAIGDVVNTTSRLQTVAPAGGVVVGETTYRRTRDLFDYEPLEPVTVKGKAEPLRVWLASSARSRFGAELQRAPSTALVDREDELELLKRIFSRAVREPSIQLVTVMGEPGVGKSRTLLELFRYIDDLPDLVFWRQGRCLPYGEGVTFWAFAGIVKAQAGILDSDGAEETWTKLEASVGVVADPAEREWVRSKLAPLIGLDASHGGTVDRTEVFSAWRRYLEAIASVHPLVIAIEDLHWADSPMLEFVEYLVDWSVGLPILVLCTARPELLEREARWGGGKRNSSIVSLSSLTHDETRDLVSSLLSDGDATDVDRVVERSGGNPLFAEELARMLGEGPVASEGSDSEASRGLGSPPTVHAIIAARLDTLAGPDKALLQDASVVGNVFWPGALADVGDRDVADVRARLHELARKGLVRPSRVSLVGNETEYSFAHALVRDVAYAQIPRRPRATKHVAVARWTERMAGERVSDHAEVLAHHYGQALELMKSTGSAEDVGSLQAAAGHYWMLAGERAMSLDIARAERYFDAAQRLLPPEHPDRPRALARRGEACLDAGRYEEAQRLSEEAAVGFGDRGDLVGRGASLDRLATVLWERGDQGWRDRLSEAVQILEGQPPGPELADCYASVSSGRLVSGFFEEAVEWADRALTLARSTGVERLEARAHCYRGMARACLGDLGGLDDLENARLVAEQQGLSREHAQALEIEAELRWAIDGPAKALEVADAASDLAERRGVVDELVASRALRLGPLFDLGRWDELGAVAADVAEWSSRVGGDYSEILSRPWSAQVLLWRGDRAGAAALATETLDRARRIRDPQILVPALAVAGLVAIGYGRGRDGTDLVEELDGTTDVSLGWYLEQFIADLVRVCAAGGRPDLARRLLDRVHPSTPRHRLSVRTAEATLAEAMGDREEAAAAYSEAARGWTEFGHVLEAGLAWLGAGRCLGDADPEAAAALARSGREAFDRLGAAPLVGRAAEVVPKDA